MKKLILVFLLLSGLVNAQTQLQLPVGVENINGGPTEWKYGPYASTTSAKTILPSAIRFEGLTVKIVGGAEFWWPTSDLSDGALVSKFTSIQAATSSTAGITKLYTVTGSHTDGTMDQNSITNAISGAVVGSYWPLTGTGTTTGAITITGSTDIILVNNPFNGVHSSFKLATNSLGYTIWENSSDVSPGAVTESIKLGGGITFTSNSSMSFVTSAGGINFVPGNFLLVPAALNNSITNIAVIDPATSHLYKNTNGVFNNIANTYSSGATQSFTPSTTLAGINVGSFASDPSSPSDGDIYYNTTAHEFRSFSNFVWYPFGSRFPLTSVTGTSNRINSSGGNTPIIDISSSYVGQASITTTGALSSGSLASGFTPVTGAIGGTGVANTGKTITLSGNFVTSGAFATTLTSTATTNVTLPTTGTLSTLAGTESLTNKSVNGVTLVTGGTSSLYLSQDGTYAAPSGSMTSITFLSPLTGGTISTSGSAGIADAVANGTGKGAATFEAADFNSSAGDISIDYTNGQKATTSIPGFLTAADWATFNGKQSGLVSGTSVKTVNGVSLLGSGDVGVIDIPHGGTGLNNTALGDIFIGGTSNTITKIGIGTDNQTLTMSPSTSLPVWSSINIVDLVLTSASGSTITLDCNSQYQRMFITTSIIGTPKTLAITNITNVRVFDLAFEINSTSGTLTLPSGWLMSDVNFSTHLWTPPSTGKFEMTGTYDGGNWRIKIAGPFL